MTFSNETGDAAAARGFVTSRFVTTVRD